MNIIRRLSESLSPSGQNQDTPSTQHMSPAAYEPHFRIGYSWYPGVSGLGGIMHNKMTIYDLQVGVVPNMHTPIDAPRFSAIPRRSIRMGVIDNANHGYPLVTPRIVMPEVRRV